MKTFNILKIKQLGLMKGRDEFRVLGVKAIMKSTLEMNCREKGTTPLWIDFKTESRHHYSADEAIKEVLENFFNGRSEIEENISRVESESVGHLGIDRIEIQLEDGILKNEFERIFNASNWSEKKELKKISK